MRIGIQAKTFLLVACLAVGAVSTSSVSAQSCPTGAKKYWLGTGAAPKDADYQQTLAWMTDSTANRSFLFTDPLATQITIGFGNVIASQQYSSVTDGGSIVMKPYVSGRNWLKTWQRDSTALNAQKFYDLNISANWPVSQFNVAIGDVDGLIGVTTGFGTEYYQDQIVVANGTISAFDTPAFFTISGGTATPNGNHDCGQGSSATYSGATTSTTNCNLTANWGTTAANTTRSLAYYNNYSGSANPGIQWVLYNDFVMCSIPPTVSKSFSPATISAPGTSTLTITLSHSYSTAISTTAAFTDTLPLYVQLNGTPTTTCTGTVTGTAGANEGVRDKVTLASGATIPASGSCTITVPVKSHIAGTHTNTIDAGALQTVVGNNASVATADLTVTLTGAAASAPQQCVIDSGATTFAWDGSSGGSVSTLATTASSAVTATYTSSATFAGYGSAAASPYPANPTAGTSNYLNWAFVDSTTNPDSFGLTYSVTPPTGATSVVRYYGRNAAGGTGTIEASLYTFTWSGAGVATVYEVASSSAANYLPSTAVPPPSSFSLTQNGEIEFVNGQPVAVGSSATISTGGTVQTFAISNGQPSWYIEFPAGASNIQVQKVVNSGAYTDTGTTTCSATTKCTQGKDAVWPAVGTTVGGGTTTPGASYNEWGHFATYLCAAKPKITLKKVMPTGDANSKFDFTLTNTAQTSGTVTVATAGTASVQVDGDTSTTTVMDPFTATTPIPAASPTDDIVITEAAATNFIVTSIKCVDAANNTVGTVPAAGVRAYTIPGTALTSGAQITCTYTNDSTAADLSITKTNTFSAANGPNDLPSDTVKSGDSTTYTLVVTNNGPATVKGAIVKDTPDSTGLNCPAANVVTCSSTAANGCPTTPSPILVSDLTAGLQLGTLPSTAGGNTVTLSFVCNVK